MNQLKSRTVSSLSRLTAHHRVTRACVPVHTCTKQTHAHATDTLGKFQVFSLHAKLLTNTLLAAHLTFISLIFAKCLSTAAAGARSDRIMRLFLFTHQSIRQSDMIQPCYKYMCYVPLPQITLHILCTDTFLCILCISSHVAHVFFSLPCVHRPVSWSRFKFRVPGVSDFCHWLKAPWPLALLAPQGPLPKGTL